MYFLCGSFGGELVVVAFCPFLYWIQSVLNLNYVAGFWVLFLVFISWGFFWEVFLLVFFPLVSAAFGIDTACLDDSEATVKKYLNIK